MGGFLITTGSKRSLYCYLGMDRGMKKIIRIVALALVVVTVAAVWMFGLLVIQIIATIIFLIGGFLIYRDGV